MEMREKGRNWGEPWEIQGDPWEETEKARRMVMQREDLWKKEKPGEGSERLDPDRRGLGSQVLDSEGRDRAWKVQRKEGAGAGGWKLASHHWS